MLSTQNTHHKHSEKSAECAACGEKFSSISAFDRHRRGSYSRGRYCLTSAQMAAIGMTLNRFNRWSLPSRGIKIDGTPTKSDQFPAQSAAVHEGASP